MTKEEFIKEYGSEVRVSSGGYCSDSKYITGCISVTYETGGVSGGSCWDDSDPQPYIVDQSERDDKLTKLDELLIEVAPKMSYLEYKKIERLVKYTSYTYHEYYGNCVDYGVNYIELDKLYDALIEMGYTV